MDAMKKSQSIRKKKTIPLPELGGKRVAVLGMGNELKGDDIAGVLASRLLKIRLRQSEILTSERLGLDYVDNGPAILVIEAGLAPENFSGTLRRFKPDWVLVIDAAQMGLPAGSTQSLEWQDVTGFSGSTHILPPSVMAEFLINELGCNLMFIGIQPASTEFDAPISRSVALAVRQVTKEIIANLNSSL